MNSKDISVVVQGAINKTETKKCLKSIRKFLLDAEIILSTWKKSNVDNLVGLYDKLILNEDVGATVMAEVSGKKLYNNMNRQLFSTQEGIKRANRKYILKLRSDLILSNNSFLEYFEKYPKRGDEYILFDHKLLVSSVFTLLKRENGYLPFHISDWWLFGLSKDIKTYFLNTPMVKEPDFSDYFKTSKKVSPFGKFFSFKFSPEQYFGYSCFSKNFDDIYMEDATDVNDLIIEKYRKCLINNFIVLDFKRSGIYLNKYPFARNELFATSEYKGLYSFYVFEKDYQKYCDKNYKIIEDDRIFRYEEFGTDLINLYKHISRIYDNRESLKSRLENLFIAVPFCSIKLFLKHWKILIKSRKTI